MNEELAQNLVLAICRRSAMIADHLGLPLTERELGAVYELIGQHYLKEKATAPFMPTVAQLLRYYEALEK